MELRTRIDVTCQDRAVFSEVPASGPESTHGPLLVDQADGMTWTEVLALSEKFSPARARCLTASTSPSKSSMRDFYLGLSDLS